ncbi:E3 ubiquitin-protein ligase RHA2A [Heracleum sosnowskyi]|uniref:E3 ubiquitin-protein ligase RHA2A n=1 Tax=Heracleum sosnowskyi TaxID=360622 RepID=A0AAD8I990_9APIA|nr:E3 ubiquitin-protein ligase RHA2A [Heracleum sosnowskyi]
MGLQNQMNDVSSDSFPILILLLIANGVGYLRSILLAILPSLNLCPNDESSEVVSSGLAVLAEQLNFNRRFSYRYNRSTTLDGAGGSDCVVCLSRLKNGEYVRRTRRKLFEKDRQRKLQKQA